MSVELRGRRRSKPRVAVDLDAAPAAHARAVDHDRVQTDDRLTPKGRVVCEQNFIITAGPMANMAPIRFPASC